MKDKMARNRTSVVRDKIIEVLSYNNEALAHKDMQDIFQHKWDRVTIYRAINRLIEEGKIHRITENTGRIKYSLCNLLQSSNAINHIHFNCKICNKTMCIEAKEHTIHLPVNFEIDDVHCTVKGICAICKRANIL